MKDKTEYCVALFYAPPPLINEGLLVPQLTLLYFVPEFFTKYKIKIIKNPPVFSNVSN